MPTSANYNRYPRRTAPPLPDPDSLPFPANLIRRCSDCGLRAKAKAPVPGCGSVSAEVMLVGQNPGKSEDEWGYKPFVGQAGRYLDSLLFQCGISRESVYITNLVKCLSPGDRTPNAQEIAVCCKWLGIEVEMVQPHIVVAMGAPAISYFLGSDAGTVEHLHGKPVEKDGRIVLPAYHPAAALRNTALLRQCQEDFYVLKGLVKGASWQDYHVKDEFPNPVYKIADNPVALGKMGREIKEAGEFAVDTETYHGELWSVQISARPGTAWFIPVKSGYADRVDLTTYDATAIVHNYLFDINYLNIADDKFVDTMTLAYLLGLPQGLKALASRLCGVQMKTYSEVVHPAQQELALSYLHKTIKQEWPDPPLIEETKWDNKRGGLVTKRKKPWHISRKINKMLKDVETSSTTDLWGRWRSIPVEERAVVDGVLGVMPESGLADIPYERAVHYSCLDSDVTLRVYHKLKKMVADMGLDFVLDMDLGILPMVYSMMQNGMAIDVDHLRGLSEDYSVRMQVKAAELAGAVGHPFNPNSSPQVATVIYSELGFTPTKHTTTGLVSTDDAELKKTGHPVAEGVIRYRGIQKLKGTYADAMVGWAVPDEQGVSRVHTTLKTTRVATGRLASADPDLQNIPTRNKESKAIKNGFIAPDGELLAEVDYGQIEMCTQAHLAKCKGLIELFARGGDPHTETASRLFGIPLDEAEKDKYRYPCKRAGFGIIYLIGAPGLSSQINEYIADLAMDGEPVDIEPWDVPTCEKFITDYYKLYPEIRDYQQEQVAHARRYGYVRDLFGRIRYIPEVGCPIRSIQEAGARMAANMPVTSCLPADTRVTTRNGWLPIGEFVSGTEVWTGERWATANRFSMGVHNRVRLYLSNGSIFDCDVNHKLLITVGVWSEWKSVLDIKPDEALAQDMSTDWGCPLGSTEDWYWAGRFIGDGWLSGSTAKLKFWGMSFGSKEVQDGDRLMRWLDSKNIRGRTNSKVGYYPAYDHRGNFRIAGGTQAGYALWQSLGMGQKKAREKRIPSVVFTLDFDRRRAFLQGYSDADGTARQSARRGRVNSWCISSASRGLLEDTVRLAQTVGLSARISEPKTRTYDWSSRKLAESRNCAYRAPTTSTLWYCTILKNRRDITIERVEILPPEPMYTLSVDDERHAFSSEGLISKNSAQGIIKRAMGDLWRELPKTEWADSVKWLMQVHDSLLFEVDEDEAVWRPCLGWIEQVMCGVVKLLVPVRVDFKMGKTWGGIKRCVVVIG